MREGDQNRGKRVLLVSVIPFSRSSRGMDVLTQAFEAEGCDTSHLTFPKVFYTPAAASPQGSSVRLLISRLSFIPYIDSLMWWLPRFLFEIIRRINVRTIHGIVDFHAYDMVVLESGKPLFLLPEIPDSVSIIYRQSDSVALVLGRGKWYRKLENDVFSRAEKIILKKSLYIQYVSSENRGKTIVIENGMALPKVLNGPRPYPPNTQNAVYVGLHPLDLGTLKALLNAHPEVNFHICGPCLRGFQRYALQGFPNFHYHGFMPKEEFMPYVEHADLAIVPFRRTASLKWFGLTSKFLHFMFYRLPIVSHPTGLPGEFSGLPVFFADTQDGFIAQFARALDKKPIDYAIDFQYYSPESRMEEYRGTVRDLLIPHGGERNR